MGNHHWYRPQHIPPDLARWWSLSRAEKISLLDSDHAERGYSTCIVIVAFGLPTKKIRPSDLAKTSVYLTCEAIASAGCSHRLRSRRRAIGLSMTIIITAPPVAARKRKGTQSNATLE